jgi:hypothetical protein
MNPKTLVVYSQNFQDVVQFINWASLQTKNVGDLEYLQTWQCHAQSPYYFPSDFFTPILLGYH